MFGRFRLILVGFGWLLIDSGRGRGVRRRRMRWRKFCEILVGFGWLLVGLLGLVAFDEASDGTLVFRGFIIG